MKWALPQQKYSWKTSESISENAISSSIDKLNFWHRELKTNRAFNYTTPITLNDGSKVVFYRENGDITLALLEEIPLDIQHKIREYTSERS